MTAQFPSNPPVTIREFNASKQASYFESLKQLRFSGRVILTDSKQVQWVFYFYLGRIVYATGGNHPVRRWQRHIVLYMPHLLPQLASIVQCDWARLGSSDLQLCWEYQLLCLWVEQQRVTREQAAQAIHASIIEILFDITQTMEITCELNAQNVLSTRLVLIDADRVVTEAQQGWQAWQAAKIADRSPNSAPAIRQIEQLQEHTSPQAFQSLTQLLDGQQTLRDLAVRMKRDVLTVTSSLLPFIQMGLVELVPIADLNPPIAERPPATAPTPKAPTGALIACVDDSPLVCQTMEKILGKANYQFVAIGDPLRAIAVLLARKPDLIFLDLVMPNASGYEICSQLRKLSYFKTTPIVILTGNDGIVDRVRAKMVGSTDFISKPIDSEMVLGAIEKYVGQVAVLE